MQSWVHPFLLVLATGVVACKGGEPKPAVPAASAPQALPTPSAAATAPAVPSAEGAIVENSGIRGTRPMGAIGIGGTKDKPERFGTAFEHKDVLPLASVIAQAKKYADQEVQVEGLVRRACSRKGCWMELAPEQSGPGCRVTFRDYGFFVPTDSAGAQARLAAVVKLETLEPNQVRHHEREGATFANKNADGSADEIRLVASGVELWH